MTVFQGFVEHINIANVSQFIFRVSLSQAFFNGVKNLLPLGLQIGFIKNIGGQIFGGHNFSWYFFHDLPLEVLHIHGWCLRPESNRYARYSRKRRILRKPTPLIFPYSTGTSRHRETLSNSLCNEIYAHFLDCCH